MTTGSAVTLVQTLQTDITTKEARAKRAFLEQEANQLFAPLEDYLTKLDRVLQAANASVEVQPTWEHLGERKLRRTAKVILRETAQHLPLDLTIEGVTIFYRNRPYRFTRAVEALIPLITSDVEQFIIAQSRATTPAHLALTSDQPLLIEHLREIIEP